MKTPKYLYRTNFYWRVKVRNRGVEHVEYFGFHRCGGVKLALKSAVAWRDDKLKKFGMFAYVDRARSPDLRNKRNTYPCIGVYFADNRNWIAVYYINKNRTKKAFSAKLYGNCMAFQMACQTRYLGNGELIVINPSLMPCKPHVPYRVSA